MSSREDTIGEENIHWGLPRCVALGWDPNAVPAYAFSNASDRVPVLLHVKSGGFIERVGEDVRIASGSGERWSPAEAVAEGRAYASRWFRAEALQEYMLRGTENQIRLAMVSHLGGRRLGSLRWNLETELDSVTFVIGDGQVWERIEDPHWWRIDDPVYAAEVAQRLASGLDPKSR